MTLRLSPTVAGHRRRASWPVCAIPRDLPTAPYHRRARGIPRRRSARRGLVLSPTPGLMR